MNDSDQHHHDDPAHSWTPESWRNAPAPAGPRYDDERAFDAAVETLRRLPPLVTSWEIERLKSELAQAQQGRRFVLMGGDCAETFADCTPSVITNKLKILLQMSLVLVHGGKKPVVRIGRIAGQYAKPRSSLTETRMTPAGSETLPSYFGDLINHAAFTENDRRPDPALLVAGYQHAALTLNFIRSLVDGGFADAHHPEYWDLSFFSHAALTPELRTKYVKMRDDLANALRFMEAIGENSVHELSRVEFFTSHEGLHLPYESAQTRRVPRREGYYDLSTHMPWIGERTRALDGAHIEFFRGIANPVGVKVGPKTTPDEVLALARALNPRNEPGRLAFIARMGASRIAGALPGLLAAVRDAGVSALWLCDPMHANTMTTASGVKTRSFDDICAELDQSFDLHHGAGVPLAGVHFELTGDDVTECVGGAGGMTEADLTRNYASPCDPRLNYHQAMELAFRIAERMGRG
ncbi:MAG: 3-deoxy-7-phosphoheptulonate synthase [Phycisphaeraceae bacterium]|nr:3-deoxy-7-phosphoheptulonate synthase [Phycisphaeraceae bacterium]